MLLDLQGITTLQGPSYLLAREPLARYEFESACDCCVVDASNGLLHAISLETRTVAAWPLRTALADALSLATSAAAVADGSVPGHLAGKVAAASTAINVPLATWSLVLGLGGDSKGAAAHGHAASGDDGGDSGASAMLGRRWR